MKNTSILLFTFLLTLSYNSTAKEKVPSVQKQATTNAAQLPPVQLTRCTPYPLCANENSNLQKTESLLDWFVKQIPALEQNKDSLLK